MSSLIVEVCKIEEIIPHPNADALEQVRIKGWTCIVRKDTYKVGDLVVYVPVDALIPEELSNTMNITQYLGKNGRVKTVKLRGVFSQGVIIPLDFIPNYELINFHIGDDFASALGITKYEPPPPSGNWYNVRYNQWALPPNPNFHKYTDIENIKNFPDILQVDEFVVVTEKIHGTNFRASKVNGEFLVGSHNVNLKEHDGNLYWKMARKYNLENILIEGDIIYGEIYGPLVQPNFHYNRKDSGLVFFDLFRDNHYLNPSELEKELKVLYLPQVPILDIVKWSFEVLNLAAGRSTVGNNIKEGIVIKPVVERYDSKIGRVVLKHISEQYLLKDYGDSH